MESLTPKDLQLLTGITGKAILEASRDQHTDYLPNLRRIHAAVLAINRRPAPVKYQFCLN
jgi:hypothetical protein